MSNGEEMRGNARRGADNGRANLRSSFRETGAVPPPLVTMAKIHRAADLVSGNAIRHYQKHREAQINKAYTRLLLKSAPTLTLVPPGMANDPKALLMVRARREVTYRQGQRLLHIEEARKRMLKSGRLRDSRSLEWGGNIRGQFTKETRGIASPGQSVSREQVQRNAKIGTAQDRARRKAEAHRVKHQEKWTSAHYRKLTSRFDFAKMSQTDGQNIRDVAMEAANRSVRDRHEARLQKIDAACNRMRETGNIRQSRPMGRNFDLGR